MTAGGVRSQGVEASSRVIQNIAAFALGVLGR